MRIQFPRVILVIVTPKPNSIDDQGHQSCAKFLLWTNFFLNIWLMIALISIKRRYAWLHSFQFQQKMIINKNELSIDFWPISSIIIMPAILHNNGKINDHIYYRHLPLPPTSCKLWIRGALNLIIAIASLDRHRKPWSPLEMEIAESMLYCHIPIGHYFSCYTGCLRKKYGVAVYRYVKTCNTQQCNFLDIMSTILIHLLVTF